MKYSIARFALLFNLSALSLACPVHTWHKVTSIEGPWHGELHMISEMGTFVDETCTPRSHFSLKSAESTRYALQVSNDNTFDMAYTLTMVKTVKQSFVSPSCVFIITADAPAHPVVEVLSYNGARCQTIHEDTLDFTVG